MHPLGLHPRIPLLHLPHEASQELGSLELLEGLWLTVLLRPYSRVEPLLQPLSELLLGLGLLQPLLLLPQHSLLAGILHVPMSHSLLEHPEVRRVQVLP